MVSINTNISALLAQTNLQRASAGSQSSIARLSSGNRIIRARDDAAGLAVGTGLRTDVSTLRTALTNTSQANSVLSIADGALFNIGEILQRQKALASQSNSGSLSGNERAFLDQEFQNLVSEIDRISSSTNFNGIGLLDGSIAGDSGIQTDTDGSTAQFKTTITFDSVGMTAGNGTMFTLNGIVFSAGAGTTDVTNVNTDATTITLSVLAGSSVSASSGNFDTTTSSGMANAIAFVINNITATDLREGTGETGGVSSQRKIDLLSGLTATVSGNDLIITSKMRGAAGQFVTSKPAATTEVTQIVSGNTTVTGADGVAGTSSSRTDTSGSLGQGVVTSSGTVGDTILTTLGVTAATLNETLVAGDLGNNDTITIFGRTFTYKDTVSDADTEIQVGTTDQETLVNLVSKLNASVDPTLGRFTYEVTEVSDAASLSFTITAKGFTAEHTTDYDLIDASNAAGAESLTAGASGGVNVANVTDNEAFAGTISGFKAVYDGADKATLSIKVGDYTYQGYVSDSTPSADTIVRLYSTDSAGAGGYFEITLANGQGTSVTDQTSANTFAARLDDALSTVKFQQVRKITSFDTSGTLLQGGQVLFRSSSFADLEVASINVRQASSTNANEAAISITLADGRVFENNTDLNRKLIAGSKVELSNVNDSAEKIVIYAGVNTIDLDDASEVAQLSEELQAGFSSNSGGLEFQVGIKTSDSIAVALDGTSSDSLYGGVELDVTTVESAIIAGDALDAAIDTVTALRAAIGSLQSRFDFAAANLQTSIQNTDAARGDFLDADVAEEATNFAKNQVLLQASISVLAQANQLPQNLLKLIG